MLVMMASALLLTACSSEITIDTADSIASSADSVEFDEVADDLLQSLQGESQFGGMRIDLADEIAYVSWKGETTQRLESALNEASGIEVRIEESRFTLTELLTAQETLSEHIGPDSPLLDGVIITLVAPLPDGSALKVGYDGPESVAAELEAVVEALVDVDVTAEQQPPVSGQ